MKLVYLKVVIPFFICLFLIISYSLNEADLMKGMIETTLIFPTGMLKTFNEIFLPSIIIIAIAYLVGREIEGGTIRITLLQGYTRRQIIIGKILTLLLIIIGILIFTNITLIIWINILDIENRWAILLYIIRLELLMLLPLTRIITGGICICLYTKHSLSMLGISVVIYIIIGFFDEILTSCKIYTFYYYLNYNVTIVGTQEIVKEIGVCLIFSTIFYLLGYFRFKKIDLID